MEGSKGGCAWGAWGAPPSPRRLARRARWSGGAPAAKQFAPMLDEVDEHVVAERLGRREERSSPVELGELLHEALQRGVGIEHEGVDADLLASAASDLTERGVDRL